MGHNLCHISQIEQVKNTKKHIKSLMVYKNNTIKGGIVRPTAKEMAIEMFDKKWPRVRGIGETELVNLRYGNYYQQLLPFFEVFGRERFIFLDGTNMGMILYLNHMHKG